MKQKTTIYDIIAITAVIATPLAPAFRLGWHLYTDALERILAFNIDQSIAQSLAIAAAMAAVIGLEAVGILAGHRLIDYIRRSQWLAAFAALAILGGYVYLGGRELRGEVGETIFYIAFLAYLATAMHEISKEAAADERADETRQHDEEREEKRRAEEREERESKRQHEKDLAQIAADERAAIAAIEAEKAARIAEARGKVAETFPKVSTPAQETYTDWRTIPDEVKRAFLDMSLEEMRKIAPEKTDKTLRNWQKNARESYGNFSKNGAVKHV